jgi:hypothetical protein
VAGPLVITTIFERCVRISRLQRFQEFMEPLPGALPQAFTFRAFGAETQSFHTVSVATGWIFGTQHHDFVRVASNQTGPGRYHSWFRYDYAIAL